VPGTKSDQDEILLNVTRESYGSLYSHHLLEQYKLYVEMADRVSARRATMNSLFVTANAALLAVLGALSEAQGSRLPVVGCTLIMPAAGILLCGVWYVLIRSYRQLNTAKWNVVGQIERLLPISPYAAEWRELGGGRDWRRYLPLTHVESGAIAAFLVLHATILITSLSLR
jgi:hypothetical protein